MQPTTENIAAKRENLNIRIKADEKALIDHAARLQKKTRTEFILEAARKEAEDALLDRSLILVAPEAYAAFIERLDAIPQPNDRLKRSLRTPAPWNEQ